MSTNALVFELKLSTELRNRNVSPEICFQAADALEAQRAAISHLREELRNMCDLAEYNSEYKGKYLAYKDDDAKDIAKARAVLSETAERIEKMDK